MNQLSNRLVLAFIGVLLLGNAEVSFGQSISDCEGAITLCGDLYQETEASFNTGAVYEYTGMCNQNLEQSSVWYTFTVQEDGLLSFIIDPLNPMDDTIGACLKSPQGGAMASDRNCFRRR